MQMTCVLSLKNGPQLGGSLTPVYGDVCELSTRGIGGGAILLASSG